MDTIQSQSCSSYATDCGREFVLHNTCRIEAGLVELVPVQQ